MGPSAGASTSQDTFSNKPQNALPQYGFGQDVTFVKLVEGNPFLFRVHTPKAHPPHYDGTEPCFVGPKFNDEFSSAQFQSAIPSPSTSSNTARWTYADVVQYMDWTTRSDSPYVSTSFSFAWAIWEAIRRYHVNVKHDVEIAVIDASAVADRAVTAAELLAKASSRERHKDHWKWHRFAVESQDVLVWGYIPGTAVLASIPLLQVLSRLPSYFLYSDITDQKDNPLARLAWDYSRKKPSFRQFCQAMSDRFLRMTVDRRLRDTTAGSVRLALCLLRPYIHKHVSDDFTVATTHVCDLAYVIACWPGQWWAREHPEIRDLVKCVVHIVGEEMREAKRIQALADAQRMQEVIGGLEHVARVFEARSQVRKLPPPRLALHASRHSTLTDIESEASPTEVKSDGWSTTSTSTLATMESKAVQTDDVEIKVPSKSDHIPPTTVDAKPLTPSPQPALSIPDSSSDDSLSSHAFEIVARTASRFLTGFFIGSFITLCVFSSHRRELANHLT